MSLDSMPQQPPVGPAHIRPSLFDPSKQLPTLPSLSSSNSLSQQKRKRSNSKNDIKPNKVVKKSSSTPNMSKPEGSQSGDEKKRNKLGYHRTSVACGHCRRRKIRCMMPDDDPSGRCSNCIRLKKECNFYPVDSNMPGKGPNPRAASLPKNGIRTNSPSPMVFGQPGYPETFPPYGHTSYSVPPPETGLGLFNTSTAPTFPETPYTSSYETPATSWESSPYATLPPISGAEQSPYTGYGLSISPAPQPYPRPASTFRPSPFPDSGYSSAPQSKTPSNEIGWAPPPPGAAVGAPTAGFRPSYSPPPHSLNDSARQSEQPPSLVMSSETASTPTLSEPTTLGSMSAPSGGYWNHYGAEIMEPVSKPFPELDNSSWFPEPGSLGPNTLSTY